MKNIFLILTLVCGSVIGQNTIYVDPGNSSDPAQSGSINHPYDSWSDFSIQSNNTYLMKRGTSCSNAATINVVGKNNVTLSTYGAGDRPHIIYTGGQCCVNGDGASNLHVEGFTFENGPAGVVSFGAHQGRSASFQTIRNCETIGGWRGINSEVWEPETGHIGNLLIENCIIHGCSTDGIFAKSNGNENYEGITIRGCHVYDVNQKWLELQNGTCDGDCIHLLRADKVLIENNTLDRRGSCYKFSLIVIGRTYTETAVIRNNTIYPPNQHSVWSSNAIYFQILGDVKFTCNKIIGSQMPEGDESTACGVFRVRTADISYNLFDYIGYIAGSSEIQAYQFTNNTIYFYLQGNETFFFQSANKPVYLKNNIFLMPEGTRLVNDGMNGGANVHKENNVEIYSNNIQAFDRLKFQNIYTGDFRPTRQSAEIIDKGVNIITMEKIKDISGTDVPQGRFRDIGCYEFKRSIFPK